ncbi:hypothetical protein VE01_04363 [Pseudogymnoascus verrucosus]|uniref:Rhodopsin domain-containing protein n=1 Tax=Pseudogymnoascus verrucosus TaxID=342668 RepID=A0A1B8GNH2_9PEZI|nr:uncharacterized protein VE01_04363 [Pseudogymnoascus verrucosus]OBT97393.2 hypothetical protein VE01_04363 [Pseudogymnoascus verrucosus]
MSMGMAANKGPTCVVVIGLSVGLAWVFFALRLCERTFISRCWAAEDLLLVAAVLLFTTYSTCATLSVKYGTGRHNVDIEAADLPKALYLWFLCEILYILTTVFVRLSISVFLLRICLQRKYKVIIYGTMAMVMAFSTFYLFLLIFRCSPVNFFWDQYKGESGSCLSAAIISDATIAHSVVSFTADWILAILPMALIWNLQLNRLTKVSIAAILALGLLAGVSTMVRIRYIKYSTITDNFLFETAGVAIWSTVEASLGIIAASAYTLRPLLRALFPVFHSQRCSSQTRGNQNIEMCLPARTVAADGSRSELNGSDDLNQQGCGTIGESSNDRDSGISVLKSFEVNTN